MKKTNIIIITVCVILFIGLVIMGVFYFNKPLVYDIYDSLKYAKQTIEINASSQYSKEKDNKVYYKGEKNIRIPILIYHRIVDKKPERSMAYMNTTHENFEKQIAGLLEYGYSIISYEDLIAYNKGEKALPEKVVIINFDDGFQGVYDYAFQTAKKYNIPMTTFVVDDLVGTNDYFSWDQAREMSDTGLISIYSHGKTHIKYDEVSEKTLVEYTEYAHQHIEEELGKKIAKVFTYPYGRYTQEQIEELETLGFIQNLTNNEINDSDKLDMSRLNRIYVLDHYSKYEILKMIK